ncbi:MAG TPA: GGDEF domain-containing protein [Gemmatimonadales bacterium]|nr:GGDEF domain-containing protein [Gemmatimonadales bacterium]
MAGARAGGPFGIWQVPDPFLLDAGASGELLVARIRLLLALIILAIPVQSLISEPGLAEHYVGVAATLSVVAFAALLLWLVRRELHRPWLGFLTSSVDVTIVSATLAVYLLLDQPHISVNSRVVYPAYFLALGATCLRYDSRICVLATALAVTQYSAIVLVAAGADLNDAARWAPFRYGMFSWADQVSRVIMLGAAGVLSTAVVWRIARLRHLTVVDRLTGLPNRGYLDARFAAEVARALRHERPLAMAMVDVDHFKRFNDGYGHAAGDLGLKIVTATIRRALRSSDIVARYGGEEFVVILPETEVEAAMEKLEAIRLAIANTIIPLPRQTTAVTLTVSAGVAVLGRDGDEVHALLDRADERLFRAKRAGRNRVVGPDDTPTPVGVMGRSPRPAA